MALQAFILSLCIRYIAGALSQPAKPLTYMLSSMLAKEQTLCTLWCSTPVGMVVLQSQSREVSNCALFPALIKDVTIRHIRLVWEGV